MDTKGQKITSKDKIIQVTINRGSHHTVYVPGELSLVAIVFHSSSRNHYNLNWKFSEN